MNWRGRACLFPPQAFTEDARKNLDAAVLAEVREVLTGLADFTAAGIESALKTYATNKGLKLGKVAMPLRAALTGTTTSPSVFHVAEILGREETLRRLRDLT